MEKKDVYQIVTDRILALLDAGTVPWSKPWSTHTTLDAEGNPVQHQNLVSKKPYRGINPFLLDSTAMLKGYTSPYWVSYKQASLLGGNVKKGEKGNLVTFWKFLDEKNPKNPLKPGKIPFLRYYNIFNLDQTENIDVSKIPFLPVDTEGITFDPIPNCDAIIANFENKPSIKHQGNAAFYRESDDSVTMPERESFKGEPAYYTTIFHELGHSTGHESRCNRFDKSIGMAAFGSGSYSKEELIAEMTASMLSGIAGIIDETIEQSAAYIDAWRKKISKDPKLVVQAAGKAQKAVDCITGVKYTT